MDQQASVGEVFNDVTSLLTGLYGSEYLNFGHWDRPGLSVPAAQENLIARFGEFSRLAPGLEIIDVGCGTGDCKTWRGLYRHGVYIRHCAFR